ncbi:MAG: DNA methyltransferase [Cypionkella sp.]|nr:DNA methyltransferase [Cypionkella sp.]
MDRFYRFEDENGRFRIGDLTGAGVRKGDSGRLWRDYDPSTSGRHWAIPTGAIKRAGINGDFDTLSPQAKLDRLDDLGLIYWPHKRQSAPVQALFGKRTWNACSINNHRHRPTSSSQAAERLGYPTQKPVALLERILAASSNEGDVVLDPFCGCGTTVHAAQKMGRQWIGIDITHLAIGLIENRLIDAFPDAKFQVHGTPMDVDAARDFFDRDDKTKKEFEKWAVTRLHFVPQEKKGADGGIDGVKWFGVNEEFKAVVSVKGGMKLGVDMVRSLDAVVTAQGAQVGVLLILEPPTKPMVDWAKQAGLCEVEGFAPVPRIQIVTIEEAMAQRDRAVALPARRTDTFKKAVREEDTTRQKTMDV